MRISKNFVILFLASFLVVILGNVVALGLNFYKSWMGYLVGLMFVVLFFLIFRKHKVGFIKFLAYLLPVLFVLVVLYVNFLPFGYTSNYVVSVAEDGSVVSSSPYVWFEDAKGKKINNLSDIYSLGVINLVVSPRVVLTGANVSVSVNGTDVYLAKLNFSAEDNDWDYFWDFTKGVPSSLKGTAKYDKDKSCVYFNGSNNDTLYYPNSADMFENDSFIVYAKWKPEDSSGVNQQIVGHYNWEVWNHNSSVRFMVGRLVNKEGRMPSVVKSINESFFNNNHSAIAVYKADSEKGFTDLFVDSQYEGRQKLNNETIWLDYNGNRNLQFGWSLHNYGNNSYFTGCIYEAGFDFSIPRYVSLKTFKAEERTIKIPIIGTGNLSEIKVEVRK